MNVQKFIKGRSVFLSAALSLSLSMSGCGGGGYGNSTGSEGNGGGGGDGNSVVSIQGQWEMVFHSAVSPTSYTVVEANLTQAGTHVFAGAPSVLVYQSTRRSTTSLSFQLASFGGQCDNNGTDEVTFDATLSNPTATTETVAFTLTETGVLGSAATAVTSASVSTNGANVSGDYSRPAACGFPEDHGTFEGNQFIVRYSGNDHYHGNFNGGADSIVISFTSDATGFGLTASGTDNGTPFTLAGSTVGWSSTLTGTISGHTVTWFGVYDPLYNEFLFYDSDAKLLGSLSGNPLAP
jgi:hypothetical protein